MFFVVARCINIFYQAVWSGILQSDPMLYFCISATKGIYSLVVCKYSPLQRAIWLELYAKKNNKWAYFKLKKLFVRGTSSHKDLSTGGGLGPLFPALGRRGLRSMCIVSAAPDGLDTAGRLWPWSLLRWPNWEAEHQLIQEIGDVNDQQEPVFNVFRSHIFWMPNNLPTNVFNKCESSTAQTFETFMETMQTSHAQGGWCLDRALV